MPHRPIAATQRRVGQVAAQLKHGLLHLVRHAGGVERRAAFHILEFEYIAVPHVGILGDKRFQVQIGIPLVQFVLGVEQKLIDHAQVRGDKAVDDLFAVEVIADAGLFG